MSSKTSNAVYASKELIALLDSLSEDNKIHKWINDMKTILKEDKFRGRKIRKEQIPKHYVDKYEVDNLYYYRHPEGHRSCYTLHNFNELGVCPVILDINTHPEYEKIFGYKM